jgi:hypothetical protein
MTVETVPAPLENTYVNVQEYEAKIFHNSEFILNYVLLCFVLTIINYFICIHVKLIRYQFWCTRCAFRLLKCLQWCSGRKSWKSGKKKWKLKEPSDENQTECHEIEPNPRWMYMYYVYIFNQMNSVHLLNFRYCTYFVYNFACIQTVNILNLWAVELLVINNTIQYRFSMNGSQHNVDPLDFVIVLH